MADTLIFDGSRYTVEHAEYNGTELTYRAFEGIPYCRRPVDPELQTLSVFVPEAYYNGEEINGYSLHTAPVFFPNTIGGYMPGRVERPGKNPVTGDITVSFFALLHGYVVVSSGARGNGMKDEAGHLIGYAPAAITDLKAAVRFLKANADRVPGDVTEIITDGTSAGGAYSALLGTTGNHPDYEPYLEEMGAADADDSVFASSCYCPITNLDHADMAYEWEFRNEKTYHSEKFIPPKTPGGHPSFEPEEGELTAKEQKMSGELAEAFPDYVNSLGLRDQDGTAVSLDRDGTGTFRDLVTEHIRESAQEELDRLAEGKPGDAVDPLKYDSIRKKTANTAPSPAEVPGIEIQGGKVVSVDSDAFTAFRTRMKRTPAFDSVRMGTPENRLFGNADTEERHFTGYSALHSENPVMADEKQIYMMNPMNYITDQKAVKAEHFRIRHGAVDRDTSFAISELLALALQNAGIDASVGHPWGINHNGDYDLEKLFAWIDEIVEADREKV